MARTLVVERHDWETSGSGHQLQFPRLAFRQFFRSAGFKTFRVFVPPHRSRPVRVAKGHVAAYAQSATYRLNRILEIGSMGPGFVLIEEVPSESSAQPMYDIWWFVGKEADRIAKRRWKWRRAKDSQHGPGRRWTILARRGPRRI